MSTKHQSILILAIFSVIPIVLVGQSESIDDQIEKSAEILEMDHDYSDIVEDFADLAAKPVNLNEAKEEELNGIPYLSKAQLKGLIDYLKTYGEALSIYELQSIPGFDSLLIQKIQPFISISPPPRVPALTPKNLIRFGRHDLLLRYGQSFPKSNGYRVDDSTKSNNINSYYLGSPQRYYFRYTFTWFDKIKVGIAGKKDPGEQFFQGAQSSGMDFYTAFLGLSNIGILKNLIIGNFRASFGQGLTLGSGLSLGSVPGFSMSIPMATGIRPGLGINEGSYFRGLAGTLKIKHLEISGFASYHPRDATVTLIDTSSLVIEETSSLITSGYHRTQLELSKRNALTELVCGGNINFSMAINQQLGFKIGLTGFYNKYSAKVIPNIFPYNQFEFSGNQNLNLGLDYQLRYKRLYIFGEVSRSKNKGMAWLSGATITPDPRICITLIYRNYQPTYQNLFSNAFGQNSLNANEYGIYTAINAAIHPKFTLSGYLDLFKFPWLKYRVDSPTNGQEFGAMFSWQAARNVFIGVRFYQKNVKRNGPSEQDQIIEKLVDYITRSYRLSIEWLTESRLMLKTRVEVKETGLTDNQRSFGYLVYQEAQIKSLKWLENITLRFALFDIPDYTSRIYVYEPQVLYGYSVPAYQGKGIRGCMLLKFNIGRKIDFWLKGGITYYTDRNEVGTGLDITEGNIRGDFTGQMLIRL
ncbi:MAG: helix-hairpin-helix domain-containing protein [Bacteroidota bacterium]